MLPRGLVVLALVVLAGCAGVVPSGESVMDATATDEATATTAPNPWATDEIVVAIYAPADERHRYRNLTRRALAFWEAESTQYVGYPVDFRLSDDVVDPDVRITFVETVRNCGREDHTAGCAPLVEDPRYASLPADVEVKTGYDDDSTVQVVEHELGHVLGLDHEDAPKNVMAGVSQLTTRPQPNATEQSLPWTDREFTVYVNTAQTGDRNATEVDRQLNGAFSYYEGGADGNVPDGVRFRRVENESAADIVVHFDPDSDCGDAGSCGSFRGLDPDGDGAMEEYTRQRITLVGTDTDAIGWHVGYWLAAAFGMERPDERPPPLQPDATFGERRSSWWD
ncbi:matrixin family metalloprotease [Haloarculaceae archaeon H-GB11]|nr:matrixin family metalloprotease [Haloarculaceae archaeon H-GB1-1]MEA5385774.1 matrixin family metalloprotease [Haloarculaceae archaeon H-GB11]